MPRYDVLVTYASSFGSEVREFYLALAKKLGREQYLRPSSGPWRLTATSDLNAIVTLPSIGCELPVSEIFGKVPHEFVAIESRKE